MERLPTHRSRPSRSLYLCLVVGKQAASVAPIVGAGMQRQVSGKNLILFCYKPWQPDWQIRDTRSRKSITMRHSGANNALLTDPRNSVSRVHCWAYSSITGMNLRFTSGAAHQNVSGFVFSFLENCASSIVVAFCTYPMRFFGFLTRFFQRITTRSFPGGCKCTLLLFPCLRERFLLQDRVFSESSKTAQIGPQVRSIVRKNGADS